MLFFLIYTFFISTYFDHDAFMHHALHVLDAFWVLGFHKSTESNCSWNQMPWARTYVCCSLLWLMCGGTDWSFLVRQQHWQRSLHRIGRIWSIQWNWNSRLWTERKYLVVHYTISHHVVALDVIIMLLYSNLDRLLAKFGYPTISFPLR